MRFENKVALITGGARGIGRAIGIELASEGWHIALCYRTSENDANSAAAAIQEAGGKAFTLQCDVSDPAAVDDQPGPAGAELTVRHVRERLWETSDGPEGAYPGACDLAVRRAAAARAQGGPVEVVVPHLSCKV